MFTERASADVQKLAIKQGCRGEYIMEPGGKRILIKTIATSSKPEKFAKHFRYMDGEAL